MNLKFSKLPFEDPRGDNAVMANFRDESLSLLEIFIREFLQNALDNRVELDEGEYQAANIKISIHQIEEDSSKQFISNIFNSALPFINSLESESFEIESTTALVLEENNTQGITGLISSSDDDGNWAKFWHSQSSSDKRGNKNGRAGQGKISYHMISSVYTVFALSSPATPPDRLYLMGKCILPSNPTVDTESYKSHAFISNFDEIEQGNLQPMPFEDSETIKSFSDAFSITRNPGDYGTSWVIPFPKGRPKEKEIIKATIKGYFYSILMNKLSIQIGNELINSETILELSEKYISKSESEFYSFIQNTSDSDVIYRSEKLSQRWLDKTNLPEDILSPEKTDKLKSDYNSGEIVCIKLPIVIDSKKYGKLTSYFSVYLQSRPSLEESRAAFVRTDLIISKESDFLLRQHGNFFGLVVADHESIANFLAHCEEPNHTKFNYVMKAAEVNYNSIKKTLTNIRMGASRVYSFLEGVNSGMHVDALIDVLSVMGFKKPPTPTPDTDTDTDTADPDVIPEIYSDNKYFRIEDDGESVKIRPGVEKFNQNDLPVGLALEAGYESPNGDDPYKHHHHFDFDFTNPKSIFINQNGMTNIESLAKPNQLKLHIDSVDFLLELSGFSLVERLRIRATPFEVNE